jgi:erythromycin esterase-like protein
MNTNLRLPELQYFEKVRVSLTNANNNPEIKAAFSQLNFTEQQFAEGNSLLNKAIEEYETNRNERIETKLVRGEYNALYTEFRNQFREHRDKVRIFFTKNPEVILLLGVIGKLPTKHVDLFEKTKQFYFTIREKSDVQDKVSMLRITPDVVDNCIEMRDNLMKLRSDYERETGEDQAAIKVKDQAISDLKEWVEDFDNIARVALYHEPQLLESIGIFVRS